MRPNSLVIISKDGKLLASKGVDNKTGKEFCRLLGGGIEFGETSLIAAQREFKEELGATLKNEKLLQVIENIFQYNGKPGHEITFLYKADLDEEKFYETEKLPILDKQDAYAEWISIDEIKAGNITLYPKETINYL